MKERGIRYSPYTPFANVKSKPGPVDRLMLKFHKNTSPYKVSTSTKVIKRWNSDSLKEKRRLNRKTPSLSILHASTIKNNTVIRSHNIINNNKLAYTQSHTPSPSSFSTRKLKRLASPNGPNIIFNEITKQNYDHIDTYAENGIASLYERIHIATGSAAIKYREEEEDQVYKLKGRNNEGYFKHKLDKLKERLKSRPFPKIKQNYTRDPLFLDYTLRLRHLDSNYLKVLMAERNKKVEKLRQKHNLMTSQGNLILSEGYVSARIIFLCLTGI
eukprot:g9348.t1